MGEASAVQLVRDLAVAATSRVDGVEGTVRGLEGRVHALELANAEAKGASLARLVPWFALVISTAGLLVTILKAL